MGKKKARKTKVSKGLRNNIRRDVVKEVARDRDLTYYSRKLESWLQGQDPWVSIKNNDGQTNRPFKRVKATELWGKKRAPYNIFFKKEKTNVSHLQ